MRNDIRHLTQDEIENFPGTSSVNVAIQSTDGNWHYGDYNAMDGEQFVTDEDGDYIPVEN